jgi:hypothetical protein
MSDTVYILAKYFRIAEEVASQQGLKQTQWQYVSNTERFYGLRCPIVWKVGDWWEHPCYHGMHQRLALVQARMFIVHDGKIAPQTEY